MKSVTRYLCSLLLIFACYFSSQGQNVLLKGKVTDDKTNDPLPYVNIGVKDTSIGTFSNEDGQFRLELPPGTYILVISSVGYEKIEKTVVLEARKTPYLDLQMRNSTQELNTVVVSASKYAQRIQESISSIEVLQPTILQNSNIQTIDKALDKVPGVTIMDNEPQIRAGSGFTSGLGSRVMVMVDEIPLLRGDAGRPVWDLMPVHEIDQIEVVKGASSVVYGSSALSGAINVRTAWPKDDNTTKITAFTGLYSKPSVSYATPWNGWNPMQMGLTISHMQQFSHVDVGGSLSYYNDQGYLGKVPEWADSASSTTGNYNRWLKLSFNTRVRSKNLEGLTYGLNGTIMTGKNAQTYFWFDSDTNIYRPYPGSVSNFQELTMYFDPFLKYVSPKGTVHSFKNRAFYNNTHATNNQNNLSFTLYDEYQFQKKFRNLGNLVILAGAMNTFSYAFGQVFSGILSADSTTTADANGTYTSDNVAVYAQVERKFFNRLNVLIGGRYEYFTLGDIHEGKPVFRAGVNLQASKTTFIRASVGQGYRFPSIGERYITTTSGNFGFYPNPDLIPENSLSTEIGLKQQFRIGKFYAFADVAGFYELYDNYIEFAFGFWGRSPDFSKDLGFKFFNTGPARIYGIDCNVTGQGEIGNGLNLSVLIGYTYSMPQCTDTGYVFYKDKKNSYTYMNTSSDTHDFILKYRIQNVFKGDIDLSRKRWSGGVSGRYYGYINNIDKFFYDLQDAGLFDIGIEQYRAKHHKGNFIVDMRVGYTFRAFKFSVIVDNVMNTQYSLRPATIQAPRLTTLQVVYNI
jgi:outer membrane cobalamin receptor